jgi:hypothetical protein
MDRAPVSRAEPRDRPKEILNAIFQKKFPRGYAPNPLYQIIK